MSDTQKQSGWVGWAVFGGIVVIIDGVFDALFGLAAAHRSEQRLRRKHRDGQPVAVRRRRAGAGGTCSSGSQSRSSDVFVLRGASWARITAVVLVSINAVSQLATLPVQPWWALTVIALDILVIYALIVHGKALADR